MSQDSHCCSLPDYEAPRLEPAAAFRGPHSRVTGATGPVDAWNIVCNDCSSGGQ
jgi:hypothetical protein